jgi:hypothetical protein
MKIILILASLILSWFCTEGLILVISNIYDQVNCYGSPVETDLGTIRVSSYECGLNAIQSIALYVVIFTVLFISFQFLVNKYILKKP